MEAITALFDLDTLRTMQGQACDAGAGDTAGLLAQAAAAALAALQAGWPQARRLLVLAGPGNNGGTGYRLARLASQTGWQAQVVCTVAPQSLPARAAADAWRAGGGSTTVFAGQLPAADVVVDALYGTGLNRALAGKDAALVTALNASGQPVLALDVPSGVLAGNGQVPGEAVRASVTLAFLLPLLSLRCGPALPWVGHYRWAPLLALPLPRPAMQLAGMADLAAALPARAVQAHKGQHGHVLVIGGDHGTGGAAMLAAEAALRSGAGLVSVATRAAHVAPLLARLPEAMAFDADDHALLASRLQASSCVVIGPGLGQAVWGQQLWQQVQRCGKPMLLDADALNLLAASPHPVPGAVLTPHPGEAARLLGTDVAGVQVDRPGAVQALVERFAATVVLKGAGSLVGSPGQRPALVEAGNPGMAVGGMGDVLSGVIAALIGQGLPPHQAARAGTLMHAVAGDRAAGLQPRGLLPTDLMPHLRVLANPEAVR